ncbi:MAG: hypothetical protein FWC80_02740 [Firmicutes bacterium]|nr:hypothetical protein [Bacillota bacterium]
MANKKTRILYIVLGMSLIFFGALPWLALRSESLAFSNVGAMQIVVWFPDALQSFFRHGLQGGLGGRVGQVGFALFLTLVASVIMFVLGLLLFVKIVKQDFVSKKLFWIIATSITATLYLVAAIIYIVAISDGFAATQHIPLAFFNIGLLILMGYSQVRQTSDIATTTEAI